VIKVTKTKFTNAVIIIGVLLLLVLPACAAAPVITSTTPGNGLNNTNPLTVSIAGSNFADQSNTTVYLNQSGQPNRTAINFNRVSDMLILANFDLTAAHFGPWNVTVVNNSESSMGIGLENLTVYNNPPTLSGISPATGMNNSAAVPFTLSGTGFFPTPVINLTGVSTNITGTILSQSGSTITGTFNLSGAPAGLRNVVLTNPDGNTALLTSGYNVTNPAPIITGVSPAQILNNVGGYAITINGLYFQPGVTVAFSKSGQPDIPQIGIAPTTTQIIATLNISNINGGWWNVTVTNPDGQFVTYTNALHVLYPNAPTITTISPGIGVNNGNLDVTITGNNFVNTTVVLNKTGHSNITATVNSLSITSINATFPLNGVPAGTWDVIVQNDDGQSAKLTNGFITKYPAPVVLSISPSSGTNTGIINITDLHGSGFMTGATVKLSRAGEADIPGTSVIVDSQNRILCLFDLTGRLAGPWNVTVTNTDLQSGTLQGGFTITQPAPTVTTITPNVGVNNGSVSITNLTGNGFVTGATVRLNKTGQADIINSTPVVVVNPGKITTTFNLVGAATGQWNVIVTNLDSQSATLTNGFTISNAAPDISGIDPSTGPNNGPVGIFNLSGHNFQSGATVSLYKGVLSPIPGTSVNVVSPTKITCFFDLTGIPVGAYNVRVINPDTQGAVLENGFHVFYPVAPAVTGITPDNGINIAPVSTTITGSEFHTGLTANLTKGSDIIPGTVSGITSGSFTSVFNITGAAVGTWDLKVTNDDGQFAISTGAFTVTAPVPPSGNVTADPVSGTAPLSVQFNLTATGTPPFTYLWTFGDGGNSTQQNPFYVYSAANTYNPTVKITNVAGNVTVAGPTILVTAPIVPPVASFTTTPSAGDAPLSVQFNDTSSGSQPFTYLWTFGDGIGTSTTQNPVYNYLIPGVYTANLTVNNSAGTSSANRTITVTTAPFPPVANFTATPVTGFKPLYVQFNDASGTNVTSWLWKFGYDDYSAGTQNPDFTYTVVGNYTVNLTVTNSSGTNTVSKPNYIVVTNKPVSNFTASPTSGIRPLQVNFTDLSTDANAWFWDFGDGTNSTTQNPGHVYSNEGTYSVSLTAKNAGGSGDTVVKINYISATIPGPVANFTAAPTHGDVPLTVHFNDTSINGPTSWNWDFGDYTSSNQQNPSHIYTTPGLYTVRLEVSNSGGSNTSVMPNLINATQPKPNADFTGYPASGITGETEFHFIDLSTNNPTAWDWNFGDGSPHATTKNATHIYQTKNSYYVSLTATNAGGSDTETKGPIVVKNPRAIANFTGTPTLGSVPLTVQFTDTSSNFPNTWAWDFGDNTFARDIKNPVHTYNKAGSYTVTLAVNDTTAGQPASSVTKRAYITVVNTPIAEFTASPTSGTAPLFVRFTDQSQGNPIRFYWKFGDGTYSNAKNPTHYYKRPGVYTVTETVQNAAGLNTTVKQNLISVTEMPQASFFVNATSGIAPTTIRFTDTSTGVPNTWNWEFGDGSPGSSEQNPVHTYYSSGVYSIQLTVSNGIGSSTVTKPSLITIGTPTGADFTFKPAEGDVPLMIQFTDNSAGGPIYIYKWQFGDGYSSREQNPVHTYLRPGNYTVSLTITTNTGAVSTISKEVVLTGTPVASFKANPTGGSSPLTVQFTDTSSNAPTDWFWTYGDGTFGNVRNPVHTYNSPGTYTVKLRASNSYGDDTITYTNLISVSQFP
jgi:PKD repeat protein